MASIRLIDINNPLMNKESIMDINRRIDTVTSASHIKPDKCDFNPHILRKKRRQLGYSTGDVAIIIGVSKAAINYWEGFVTCPNTANLYKLCKLYRLNPKSVIKGEPLKFYLEWLKKELEARDHIKNFVKAQSDNIGESNVV